MRVGSWFYDVTMPFVILVIALGLIALYWQWALAAVALYVGVVWARNAFRDRANSRNGLLRRIDEQHTQVMSGDDRGVYGAYPPAQVI